MWSGGCCCGSLLLEDCGGCLGCAGGRFRGSGGSPCGLAGGFLGLALWSWAWRMVRAVEGARVTTVISHPWGWSCNSKASPSTVNRELGSRSSRAGASVMVKSHVSGASRGASRPRIPRLKIGAVARGPACPTRTVRRGGSPAEEEAFPWLALGLMVTSQQSWLRGSQSVPPLLVGKVISGGMVPAKCGEPRQVLLSSAASGGVTGAAVSPGGVVPRFGGGCVGAAGVLPCFAALVPGVLAATFRRGTLGCAGGVPRGLLCLVCRRWGGWWVEGCPPVCHVPRECVIRAPVVVVVLGVWVCVQIWSAAVVNPLPAVASCSGRGATEGVAALRGGCVPPLPPPVGPSQGGVPAPWFRKRSGAGEWVAIVCRGAGLQVGWSRSGSAGSVSGGGRGWLNSGSWGGWSCWGPGVVGGPLLEVVAEGCFVCVLPPPGVWLEGGCGHTRSRYVCGSRPLLIHWVYSGCSMWGSGPVPGGGSHAGGWVAALLCAGVVGMGRA